MVRFRLAHAAKADLASILATSRERWGESGRMRYRALVIAALRMLGENPDHRLSRDGRDTLPKLRSFHPRHLGGKHGVKTPVHVIYYRRVHGRVVVHRVLHERMAADDQLR